ncbi:reverse transcriptase domain-containing protein, partial [Tanacetum coccineum]
MINQGVTAALAALNANRNGDNIDTSGMGGRRTERALTWWNSYVMTVIHDVAYAMTWTDLRKKMTDKYCPRNKMKKLEAELWNLKEPDMIHGNIVASKPKTMQEAVEMATELMDKKVSTIAEKQAENKRKFENTSQTRDRTLAGPILQELVKRSHMGDLNPYALSATITTTVRVLQNATNATKLVILLVTIGVREMATMLTIRGVLGLARNLLASSVE